MSYTDPKLDIYFKRLLKITSPELNLSGEALSELNNINKFFIDGIMKNVNMLVRTSETKTVSDRELKYAVKLFLSDSLFSRADSFAQSRIELTNKNSGDENYKGVKKSELAGLTFPVSRIRNIMTNLSICNRLSYYAPIYLSAVLEFLNAEIFKISGEETQKDKKVKIKPRHFYLAIQSNEDFKVMCKNLMFGGGVSK
jgi:histone H3/H4